MASHINPLRREVRELLKKGMTYVEVRNRTGATPQMVSAVATELERRGYVVKRKSEVDMIRSRIKSMQKGSITEILDAVDNVTLLQLYDLSTKSWADAIAKKLSMPAPRDQ